MTKLLKFTAMAATLLLVAFTGCKKEQEQKGSTFTDPRDGQTYRAVKIGYFTWMVENLNFQTGNSWCYDNDENNCQKYGRLYDWNTAMTACPKGWRLPGRENWVDLIMAVGDGAGTKLKSRSPDWDGTDNFVFSAMPGGLRDINGRFIGVRSSSSWWTSEEDGAGEGASRRSMFSPSPLLGGDSESVAESDVNKGFGLSVRCVQE
ncbi:MAG: hypothetical protein LBU89_01150 [Fibromonadaceae bacterium]|nr:hypothetical protein [Fibromonadaceae bacterium]